MNWLRNLFQSPKANSGVSGESAPINTISDPDFGLLTWEPALSWWKGCFHPSAELEFTLYVSAPDPAQNSITDEARSAFGVVRRELPELGQRAAASILPDLNEDGSDIQLEVFLTSLVCEDILIEADGYAEVSFADGSDDEDYLGGHSLVYRYWPNGNREVVLEG